MSSDLIQIPAHPITLGWSDTCPACHEQGLAGYGAGFLIGWHMLDGAPLSPVFCPLVDHTGERPDSTPTQLYSCGDAHEPAETWLRISVGEDFAERVDECLTWARAAFEERFRAD